MDPLWGTTVTADGPNQSGLDDKSQNVFAIMKDGCS